MAAVEQFLGRQLFPKNPSRDVIPAFTERQSLFEVPGLIDGLGIPLAGAELQDEGKVLEGDSWTGAIFSKGNEERTRPKASWDWWGE